MLPVHRAETRNRVSKNNISAESWSNFFCMSTQHWLLLYTTDMLKINLECYLWLSRGLRLDQEWRHKDRRIHIRHKGRRVDIEVSELVGQLLVALVIPAVRSTVCRHLSSDEGTTITRRTVSVYQGSARPSQDTSRQGRLGCLRVQFTWSAGVSENCPFNCIRIRR